MVTGAPVDAPVVTPSWEVVAGTQFTTTLVDPAVENDIPLGARVEVPITRAIVSAWRQATLAGSIWSVTLDAPLDAGDYQLVWRTGDAEPPVYETFIPLIVLPAGSSIGGDGELDWPNIDPQDVVPTVQDVADLERTRTVNATSGEQEGTFNANTFPTDVDVQNLLDDATASVLSQLPDAVDPELYPRITYAIKLQTAIFIETSFFRVQQPGTTGVATSPVPIYSQLLQQTIMTLTTGSSAGLGLRLV